MLKLFRNFVRLSARTRDVNRTILIRCMDDFLCSRFRATREDFKMEQYHRIEEDGTRSLNAVTKMTTLWIGNFAFEDELFGRNSTVGVQRFEAELVACLAAAVEPGDLILTPESVPETYSERLLELGLPKCRFILPSELPGVRNGIDKLSPWGWSNRILKLAEACKVQLSAPPLNAVRKVNARSFRHALSRKFDCGLPGETCVESIADIEEAIGSPHFEQGYVLKSEWGQSGRGQVRGEHAAQFARHRNWAIRRLRQAQRLILEPRLDPVCEYSLQWDIPRTGDPTLFALTQLFCTQSGQYLSSVVRPPDTPQLFMELLIEIQKLAVTELQRMGYFGPVGIDAMVYRTHTGQLELRPMQDINARWTMGRLAVHWANRCFPAQSAVVWSHSSVRPSPAAICTSPFTVGQQPVRCLTWCDR